MSFVLKKVDNVELHNCDFVKAVLMLAVVFYHSCLFWNGNWFDFCNPYFGVSKLCQLFVSWLNSWHIYAFTLVSGYLFYHLRYESDKYYEFVSFLQKKVQRLLIPAYFVGLIWIVPVNTYFWGDWTKNFFKFFSGVGPSQLWFLFMLFDVFMMAYIVGGGLYTTIGCVCF